MVLSFIVQAAKPFGEWIHGLQAIFHPLKGKPPLTRVGTDWPRSGSLPMDMTQHRLPIRLSSRFTQIHLSLEDRQLDSIKGSQKSDVRVIPFGRDQPWDLASTCHHGTDTLLCHTPLTLAPLGC